MIEKFTFGLFTKEDTRSFMRLLAYVCPYKARIIWALVAIFGVAATESYLAAFIAPLVNQGFAPPSTPPELSTATGIIDTVENWKDQFTYLIWGTPRKSMGSTGIFHCINHHPRHLPFHQHLSDDLGFRDGHQSCAPRYI